MVSAKDANNIYKTLLDHDIPIWLVGGWGIDALLGEQTRPHKDLDFEMLVDDVVRLYEIFEPEGYRLKELWEENLSTTDVHGNQIDTAFVLVDGEGRELDVHALRLDQDGNGIPAWETEAGFIFTKADLSGEGMISGCTVRCITPESQVVCHTGYELPEKQVQDMALLRHKFGLA